MSLISKTPRLVNTSQDPGLQYLNQREVQNVITPSEIPNKNVVYEEVTKVITNVIQVNAPTGANGAIQFNQDGSYVGDTGLQYEPTTDTLTTGTIVANSITISGTASNLKLNGGTNKDVLITDGNGNLAWANVFPSVTGNSGKFLVTNGVSIDWSNSSYNSLASTTYVDNAINSLVGTAPGILDTLSEIATVIGATNNPEYSIVSQLANKANISNLAQVAFSGSYTDLEYRPTISNVGTTGNYADIRNLPTIPATIMDLGISDGSNGQVLTTDGNGKYYFATSMTSEGFSGNYNDLTNKPNISNYATTTDLSTLSNTVANITYANLSGTPTLGNLSSIDLDGNAGNILYGNGEFAAAPTGGTVSTTLDNSSAGDMDVMIYDGNIKYTSNVTIDASTGELKAKLFSGNGSSLTSLAGANVTGAVSYATTANSVTGANVSGTVANATYATTAGLATYATTANSVAVANVSGIGNLALVNKDGNASNILYGNGVFSSSPVTYGNSNVATYLANFGSNTITTTGNITANAFVGNGASLTNISVSLIGNVQGTQPNVTLQAGSYSTVFDNTGAATFPGNISTSGAFVGNGTGLTGVVLKTTGSWTVAAGTNNYSFTVPANGVYQLWVRGNIPNGVISYIATAQLTNTNLPALGTQRAWNYTGGGSPILITSMPTQFVGAEGTIATAAPAGTTQNVFVFGISNTSGSPQIINWGYVRLD